MVVRKHYAPSMSFFLKLTHACRIFFKLLGTKNYFSSPLRGKKQFSVTMIYSMHDKPILKFLVGDSRIICAGAIGLRASFSMCKQLQRNKRPGMRHKRKPYEEIELKDKIKNIFLKLAVPTHFAEMLVFTQYGIIL